MNDLSAVLIALILWPIVIFFGGLWLITWFFPKNKWVKLGLKNAASLIFIQPFKISYQASRWLIVKIFTTKSEYHLHQVFLENFPVTPLEFYGAVEEAFTRRQIFGADMLRITRLEWHLLSPRRIYVLIRFRDAICFIGGVPLGTDFLISWRYTEMPSKAWLILLQMPFLGVIVETLFTPSTFYRTDILHAFEQAVRAIVLEAANLLTQRGIRPLTEQEQRPLLREFYP